MGMFSKWSRCWLAMALLGIIGLTACRPLALSVNAAPLQLVATAASDPKTFNCALIQEFPNVAGFICEGLTFEDGEGMVQPGLAEAWELAPDQTRLTITLRAGLKWSDGMPLTATDVLFTYRDIFFNPKIPTAYQDIFKIGSQGLLPELRQLDDRRIEFILPEPFAPFLRNLAAPILPAHALQKAVLTSDSTGKPAFFSTWGTDTNPEQIVGNGPYRIFSYEPGQRLVWERNPYYWRRDNQGRQQPYIERVVWQIVASADTALMQFRAGGLDVISIGPASYALLKREEKRGNFTIYNGGPEAGTTFLTFNLNQGQRQGKPLVDPVKSRWFNQKEFRQAVAYALDRQTMVNNILRGLGTTQNSPISVQSPYHLTPEQGLKVYDYNPTQARKLLLQAGFRYNSRKQLLDGDGNPVRFTILTHTGSRTMEAIGAQIQRNLGAIGIQADFTPIDFGTLIEKVTNTLDWECYIGGITGGVEPNSGANIWLTDGAFHLFNQKPQAGQAALSGRQVADWEAAIGQLYVEGARELDEANRQVIYAETERIAQENLPFIYLVNPLTLAAVRNRVRGVKISSLNYESVLWDLFELQIKHPSDRNR